MPASSDMTEYSSGAVGLAVKALKLAQAAEKQALDNLRLLETGGGNVLDTDRQKALGLLQSQLQRRKVQVATAEAAVKAWIRCDELARQGFAVPQALSDDAKPVVLSGPAQHPVAPPSPPPTEREGVSQTSQEKEKALHGPRTRLCYCGWPARTLQRTPASPVLLVCADFGKAGACKFKDIAGTVEDQGNLDRPMQSEPSPIPTSLKDRLQSERDMLIAALQSAAKCLCQGGLALPDDVVKALRTMENPIPKVRKRNGTQGIARKKAAKNEPQHELAASMTAPHEIAACQPSAARTLCVPAYLKWRQRCVQSLSKPTVRGGMPDSLADYPAGSGGKALALGWVRKTGLGDLVVQLGKRGAAAASSSTPSWQAIKQAAPSVQQRRSPMHGWGIFAMEDIESERFIMEYLGQVIGNRLADAREKEYEKDGTGTMYLFRLDATSVVDATKVGGPARYINHSCEPNCYTKVITDSVGKGHIGIFAKKNIRKGEELCYDYLVELEPEGEAMPCFCGAPSCRGRMN